MPTYHITSNGQEFEIDAPDEATALRALKTHGGGGSGGGQIPPPPAAPAPASPGWGHWPAMLGQAAVNSASGLVNAIPDALNWAGSVEPDEITKMHDKLATGKDWAPPRPIPTIPQMNLGEIARPQNTLEALAAGGVGGLVSGLLTGAASKVPAAIGATGKEILSALPGLLKSATLQGALPGAAATGVDTLLPEGTDPALRTAASLLTGAGTAAVAHHVAGGNPVESVAAKHGVATDTDTAGHLAKESTRKWLEALPQKIEALKGNQFGQTGEDTFGDMLFGKVPTLDATINNYETFRVLRELGGKGGAYRDVLHSFGEDMPERMKGILTNIAQKVGPIEEYGPKVTSEAGVKSAGPVEENNPQMVRPGPVPGYGPTGPLRGDSFQAVVPTKPAGEVGFPVEEPQGAKPGVPQEGTVVGFNALLKDALELRKWIGENTSRGTLPKGTTQKQWDALYNALNEDIRRTMEHYGAGADWKKYNDAATKLYTAGNSFSRFVNDANPGKDTANAGGAVASIITGMQKDSGTISLIREHMPEVANEIAAAYLRTQPQGWNKLPQATKEALVPNPFDRLEISRNVTKPPSLAQLTADKKKADVAGNVGGLLGAALEGYQMYGHNQSLGATTVLTPVMFALGGRLIPPAVNALGNVMENPRILATPATGAVAGTVGNPLLNRPRDDKAR